MEKWSLSGTSEFLGSLLHFEVNTLGTYKNDTLSFVTEALVPIKLPFVTQKYIHIHI